MVLEEAFSDSDTVLALSCGGDARGEPLQPGEEEELWGDLIVTLQFLQEG